MKINKIYKDNIFIIQNKLNYYYSIENIVRQKATRQSNNKILLFMQLSFNNIQSRKI